MKKFNNQSGFVLIDLIVVIIIAGILIAVVVTSVQNLGFIEVLIYALAIILFGVIFYFITVFYERVTKRSWDHDQQKIYIIFIAMFGLGLLIYFVILPKVF